MNDCNTEGTQKNTENVEDKGSFSVFSVNSVFL